MRFDAESEAGAGSGAERRPQPVKRHGVPVLLWLPCADGTIAKRPPIDAPPAAATPPPPTELSPPFLRQRRSSKWPVVLVSCLCLATLVTVVRSQRPERPTDAVTGDDWQLTLPQVVVPLEPGNSNWPSGAVTTEPIARTDSGSAVPRGLDALTVARDQRDATAGQTSDADPSTTVPVAAGTSQGPAFPTNALQTLQVSDSSNVELLPAGPQLATTQQVFEAVAKDQRRTELPPVTLSPTILPTTVLRARNGAERSSIY